MSDDQSTPDELLTTSKVAALCGVARQTVGRWVRDGKLEAVRLPSGVIRIRRGAIESILNGSSTD